MIEEYFDRHKKVARYGIECLDDRLKGIMACELVLIGARSGAGKSTIASMIAENNKDKKVAVISLESEKNDIIMTEVYKKYKRAIGNKWLAKRDFVMGKDNLDMLKVSDFAIEELEKSKNINMYYRNPEGFNIESLKDIISQEVEKGVELIVIDHIDYFDMHNPRANENQNISEIMRCIRIMQSSYNVPVVMISHLNKGSRETKIPTQEDFMGTSNKVKEATTVILFAPDDDGNLEGDEYIKKTWICVRKDRVDGYDNKVYNVGFDLLTKEYQNGYEVYRVNYWGNKVCKIGKVTFGNFKKCENEGWR